MLHQAEKPVHGWAYWLCVRSRDQRDICCLNLVIVHHDKDNREEYDIDDDDDDNSDAPPLKFHNSLNSAIGLSWGEGNNTTRIRRKRRTVGGAAAIRKRGQIDLYAVSKRGELDNDSQATKYQKRNPKVRKAVRVVDMAGF